MADGRASALGVAILGYGAIADFHAEALRGRRRAACWSRPVPSRTSSPSSRAATTSRRVETDPARAIAADGVEAVVIASPSAGPRRAGAGGTRGRPARARRDPDGASAAGGRGAGGRRRRRPDLTSPVCHTLRYWEPFLTRRERRCGPAAGGPRNVVARGLSRRHENVGWTGPPALVDGRSAVAPRRPRRRRRAGVARRAGRRGRRPRSGPSGRAAACRWTTRSRCARPTAAVAVDLALVQRAGRRVRLRRHRRARHDRHQRRGRARRPTGRSPTGRRSPRRRSARSTPRTRDFVESVGTGRRPVADGAAILPAMRVLQAVWDRVG